MGRFFFLCEPRSFPFEHTHCLIFQAAIRSALEWPPDRRMLNGLMPSGRQHADCTISQTQFLILRLVRRTWVVNVNTKLKQTWQKSDKSWAKSSEALCRERENFITKLVVSLLLIQQFCFALPISAEATLALLSSWPLNSEAAGFLVLARSLQKRHHKPDSNRFEQDLARYAVPDCAPNTDNLVNSLMAFEFKFFPGSIYPAASFKFDFLGAPLKTRW